jgi:GAF domain-containing protein
VSKTPPLGSTPPSSLRLAGDDLLAELFEAFSELHFVADTLAGADFVLDVTLEKLPSEVALVSLFDLDKREFVVVRQRGGATSALLLRHSERDALAQQAMRSHRAVVVADASADPRAQDRWAAILPGVRSVICAPVELGGRYLGLLELANPLDGEAFSDGDGHALTYIGQQLAEFVSQRGIVLDPQQISAASSKGAPR